MAAPDYHEFVLQGLRAPEPPRRAEKKRGRSGPADAKYSEWGAPRPGPAAPGRGQAGGRPVEGFSGPAPPRPGPRASRPEAPDIHEQLKMEMFASPSAACDEHFSKNLPCPDAPKGVSDQYLVLDSFLKNPGSRIDQGVFSFNFMIQGTTGTQVIGVKERLAQVIELQMGGFNFPVLPEVPYTLRSAPVSPPTGLNQLTLVQNNNGAPGVPPTLIPLSGVYGQYPPSILPTGTTALVPYFNNPYSQTPYSGRLTVQVQEAGLQSISDPGGARHHFEFSLTHADVAGFNPTMLRALPSTGSHWDTYRFTDPLQDLPSMTLVFRGPDLPLRFLPDVYNAVLVSSDGAASPGPFLQFNVTGHGLLMGDRFFVTGFSSGVAVLDAYVNRPEGLVAAGDPSAGKLAPSAPIPTPNVFWSDPAIGTIDLSPAPALPQAVNVFIAKRRLRIPMRVRSIVARTTNYMYPV